MLLWDARESPIVTRDRGGPAVISHLEAPAAPLPPQRTRKRTHKRRRHRAMPQPPPAFADNSRHRSMRRYFFSGSGLVCGVPGAVPALTGPPGVNGNVANIDLAWFCICSCICTNMFFDCSI